MRCGPKSVSVSVCSLTWHICKGVFLGFTLLCRRISNPLFKTCPVPANTAILNLCSLRLESNVQQYHGLSPLPRQSSSLQESTCIEGGYSFGCQRLLTTCRSSCLGVRRAASKIDESQKCVDLQLYPVTARLMPQSNLDAAKTAHESTWTEHQTNRRNMQGAHQDKCDK